MQVLKRFFCLWRRDSDGEGGRHGHKSGYRNASKNGHGCSKDATKSIYKVRRLNDLRT